MTDRPDPSGGGLPVPAQRAMTQAVRRQRRAIGDALRDARAERRMPLDQLARLSGLSLAEIDWLELGKGEAELGQLLRLAIALDLPVAQVLRR